MMIYTTGTVHTDLNKNKKEKKFLFLFCFSFLFTTGDKEGYTIDFSLN